VKWNRLIGVAIVLIAFRSEADQVIQPSLVYDGSAFADLSGGLRTGSTYLGLLRFRLTLQKDATSAFVEVLNKHGGFPSDFAGDAQGVSSLVARNESRVEEIWIQQNFLDAQLSVLIGRYDLNSEFDRLQSAGLFLNSSFGVGPEFSQSGRNGPSIYPNTRTAVRIGYRPVKNLVFRAAAFDDMILGEVALLSRPSSREMPHDIRFRLGRMSGLPPYEAKLAVGAWHYTTDQHSSGIYVIGDRTLYNTVSAFGQIGIGDARTEQFSRYFGTGVVMSRGQNELGLAVAAARTHSGVRDRVRVHVSGSRQFASRAAAGHSICRSPQRPARSEECFCGVASI
jgi:porin